MPNFEKEVKASIFDKTTSSIPEPAKVQQPSPPSPLPVFPDSIPADLKKINQWVCWRYEQRDGKWTKPPYTPNGSRAAVNKPDTFSDFKTCLETYGDGKGFSGIGLVLSGDNGLVAFDFDHCVTDGEIGPDVQDIISKLGTYTEYSPSGEGIRIFALGRKPGERCKDQSKGYEIYDCDRYVTITGQAINNLPIRECQTEINAAYARMFPEVGRKETQERRESGSPSDMNDADLLEIMFRGRNGDRWRGIYSGDTSGYGSHSDADIALCGALAFYTGRDAGRMNALFRASGLMREKWNEKHRSDGRTYGQATIDKAIENCTAVYTPKASGGNPPDRQKTEAEIQDAYAFFSDRVEKQGPTEDPAELSEIQDLAEAIQISEALERTHKGVLLDKLVEKTGIKKSVLKLRKSEVREKKVKKTRVKGTHPEVLVQGGRLPENVEYCQKIIRDSGDIYERGGELVRPVKLKEGEAGQGLARNADTLLLKSVSAGWLRLYLSRKIRFLKPTESDGERPVDCPLDLPLTILENAGEWGADYIAGVLESPTITPQGRIISETGYDKPTQLLLSTDLEIDVPDSPSADDVRHAQSVIHEVIKDFPFESETDYSVVFAAILTSLCRRVLPTSPFFAIDATSAGSGKSLLATCISIISTGRPPTLLNIPPFDDKETEKRLDACLLAGDTCVLIDNIEQPVKSDRLCSIATQPKVSIRILGYSRVVDVPSNSFWMFTGNNLQFAGDITRRVLKARIVPGIENPESRKFDKDLIKHCVENRGSIVNAILTILRAHCVSGQKPEISQYGSFEIWNEFVRGAVVGLGLADPLASKDNIQDADPEKLKLAAIMDAWRAAFGERAVTVKEAIGRGTDDLYDALQDFVNRGRDGFALLNPRKVGGYLSQREGAIVNGAFFEKCGKKGHAVLWRVKTLTNSPQTHPNSPQTHPDKVLNLHRKGRVGEFEEFDIPQLGAKKENIFKKEKSLSFSGGMSSGETPQTHPLTDNPPEKLKKEGVSLQNPNSPRTHPKLTPDCEHCPHARDGKTCYAEISLYSDLKKAGALPRKIPLTVARKDCPLSAGYIDRQAGRGGAKA